MESEALVHLSRREREVAELVADGHTNREIASTLFISERTVEGHVQQINNKLGFTARTQIAAWVVKQRQTSAKPETRPPPDAQLPPASRGHPPAQTSGTSTPQTHRWRGRRIYLAFAVIGALLIASTTYVFATRTSPANPFGSMTVVAEGVTEDGIKTIAIDQSGTLFFPQPLQNRVARKAAGSSVENYAGTGERSSGGDGGPAGLAQIEAPRAVALDGQGRLYVSGAGRIRRIALDGTITTVAGDPAGEVGVDKPALKAFIKPGSLAVTTAGDIYFGEGSPARRLMKIDVSTGKVRVFGGTGGDGYSGDGGPAVHAQIGLIETIALGPRGELYVADSVYNVVRVVMSDPDHTISTLAGTGSPGFSGDGGPANRAQLNSPGGLAVDRDGNVYIADTGNHVIRRVNRAGIISTIAGTGSADGVIDRTPLGSSVGNPAAMAFDREGRLYAIDWLHKRILRFQP